MMRKVYCFVCGILLALFAMSALTMALQHDQAQAQVDELITVTVEGTSRAESEGEASKEINAWALTTTAREQLIEMIGDERYQKNKAASESKVVRQASRFIPFVNAGAAVKQPDGAWHMPVELKISSASLRNVVLAAGLLSNDNGGSASILPLVTFTDRGKTVSDRWWMGEPKDDQHKFMSSVERDFLDDMQSEFSKQGFHFIRPVSSVASAIPEAYRTERPGKQELAFFSEYFKAPMVAKGDVRVREAKESPGSYNISIKLQVLQVANGRSVAEISRTSRTEAGVMDTVVKNKLATDLPEVAKDLASQVFEAWSRGTLNANLVKLTVRGELAPKLLNSFKSGLLKTVHEIKDLKERRFEKNEVQFEVDTTGDAESLATRLAAAQIPLFESKVASHDAGGVVMDVHVAK